jgi:hypothetical protein
MTYRRWFAIFFTICLTTALLLVAGLFHAIHVVREPSYIESTGDASLKLEDAGFVSRNRACDILLYGDSTANVGLDPGLITPQTGLSTCNIATNRPVVDTLDMMPVDAFLQHNPKPKLIVFQFGPELFYRDKSGWAHNGPYSPMLILARDLPQSEALRIMVSRPAETTQFLLYILQTEIFPKHSSPQVDAEYKRMIAHAAASNGQLELGFPAISECNSPILKLYGPVDTAWIRSLHERYEAQGIKVLVRAAPIPLCDPLYAKFQQDLAGILDGPLEPLPIQSFIVGYRHTTQAGSQLETQSLIDLVKRREPALLQH